MSDHYGGLLGREFAIVMFLLVTVAISLFGAFNLIAVSPTGVDIAVALFVVVVALLTVGYVLGFVVLAVLAAFFLSRISQSKMSDN